MGKEKIHTVPDRYIQSMAPLGARCHALSTKGLTRNDGPVIKARTAVCGQRVEEWVDQYIKGADPDGWDNYAGWVAWDDEVSLIENADSWYHPAKRCSRCVRLTAGAEQ